MKKNKGITLITLTITIVVLLILAGITINYGTESIKMANLESLKTNMLLIRAKAKEYCEEANFKLGTGSIPNEEAELSKYLEPAIKYLENQKEDSNEAEDNSRPVLTNISEYSGYVGDKYQEFVTQLDSNDLETMGLKNIENPNKYLIGFDITGNKVEIYYTDGYKANGTTYYSLSELEEI